MANNFIDLLQLEDAVFQIHEEDIREEGELFSMHTKLDAIMAENPMAKADGVFRARLADDLKGKGSPLSTFWALFHEESKTKLQAQYLVTDERKNEFAMEVKVHNVKVGKNSRNAFAEAVKEERTFKDPAPTCCTEVLEKSGPQAATKHFYEALRAMSSVLKGCSSQKDQAQSHMKHNYYDRQKILLQDLDASTKCALIEQSMKSKTYAVMPGNLDVCECTRCCFNREVGSFQPSPANLKEDGSGDKCSLYFNGMEESSGEYVYITPNFALSYLCHLNMLTDLDAYYAGISYPFVYVGGLHSFFPIHIEDMSLWSVNYHHMGCPKLIIVVAPCDVLKLSLILSHYGITYAHQCCIYKLTHKSTKVFPQLLVYHNIRFKIIFQKPGDFIFFAPNAAHTGGNMGPNINEACNIGTVGWLPYGSVASHHVCNCMDNGVHINITPLIKIHKKELLPYHINRSMHMINDSFFQKSIIVMDRNSASTAVVVPAASSSKLGSIVGPASPPKPRPKPFKMCPVEGCFKKYKAATRKIMENHIADKHPQKKEKSQVKAALQEMFPDVNTSAIQSPCPDCGKLLSIFSNKHRGSNACKKRAQGKD